MRWPAMCGCVYSSRNRQLTNHYPRLEKCIDLASRRRVQAKEFHIASETGPTVAQMAENNDHEWLVGRDKTRKRRAAGSTAATKK